MSQGERRLAAIMFTDMVGYTALTQADESLAISVLVRHNKFLRPIFPRYQGKEIKTMGDSFLVEYESALDATNCAVEIQRLLRDYNSSSREDWRIRLRIGIHLGDVIHTANDVLGDAVNIASRIEPLAEPGGICISQQVFDQVRNKFTHPFVKLEQKDLKNVQVAIDVYRVVLPWEEERFPTEERETGASRRLAVLPFRNMSPDPDDEYFAEGMTEELISAVSKIAELSVISRTSVMGYKNKEKLAPDIGRELNVGALIEGSVRKVANRARITVQLIDAKSDRHLWVENYDRSLEDIFSIQSEIAEKVASSLRARLLEKDKERIEKGGTSSVEAHTLYLKGRFHLNRWDESSISIAIDYFKQAIVTDPNYALAYASIAGGYGRLGFQDMLNPKEAYAKAEEYARRALDLDESLAEAHESLGIALQNKYDSAGREREFKRAIELNPNLAEAHLLLAGALLVTGRIEESSVEIMKALDLDPLSVSTAGDAGTFFLYARQYDKAIKHLKDAIEIDPANAFYRDNLGLAYIQRGLVEEGLALVKQAVDTSMGPGAYGDLAYAYVKAGKPEEARKILIDLLQHRESRRVSPTSIASIYANLGETENAMEWLEKAYEERSGYLPVINVDFIFEPLKSEPRFQALLRKMGLA